jgi:hypothetical protein
MKYIISVIPLGVMLYLFSFAKFNWTRKNKLAAVGSILIGIAAFAFPVFLMFFTDFEF